MAKMKQLWFVEKGKVDLLEVEVPEVKANQVKVKIAYAALCATDVHQVTMGVLGAVPPMALGHEASGVIEEISIEAMKAGYQLGDHVALFPVTNCGNCEWCKKGMTQYCINAQTTGAFAEYAVVDISAIFKIPKEADLKKYALVEPTNCTLRAMDLSPIKHGSTVAIAGIGGIGSIMLNQILLSGAAKITAIDPVPEKRKLALAMGASYAIDPFKEDVMQRSMEITDGIGFDTVFEMSGSPKAAETPLKILARCGTAVYFAVFPPEYEMPLNLYELYMKEGRIQTVFTTTHIMHRSIHMIERMQTDKIIGKIMPLRDAVESFEVFHQSIYPKILLDCSEV
ncbi:zinc-binding dehydrogenase [Anoxybacterium hadale]|uniref:Zinc-binding dehydrogenase n=1 Tax=Anoxybacterium hadale TaxID=3408580 RepID=A0ACD1A8E5_9FIRM|nr:zinc-binding dehydrogenase [Clostridiales bacterium]